MDITDRIVDIKQLDAAIAWALMEAIGAGHYRNTCGKVCYEKVCKAAQKNMEQLIVGARGCTGIRQLESLADQIPGLRDVLLFIELDIIETEAEWQLSGFADWPSKEWP